MSRLPVLQPEAPSGPTRREFLRSAAVASAAAALSACSSVEELLGTHFLELSPAKLAERLRRLEEENTRRFGKPVHVSATPARAGVVFGYGLDLSRCVGCRRCAHACARENNCSRGEGAIQWIKVLELDKERGVDLAHANPYCEADAVPRPGHFYMPASRPA